MQEILEKSINFVKNICSVKEKNLNNFLFFLALKNNSNLEKFKININTKCLVLSHSPGAEIKGLGGLIAQYPKNFEVLCLTNGSSLLKDVDPVKSSGIKKQQFFEIMKALRVQGYKIFNIDDECLKNNYSTFKKIDVSEVDYIFIPNIYNNNIDSIFLLKHFKQLLKEKEHKKNLKIIMFESENSLCAPDSYADITHIVETKKRMLEIYYPTGQFNSLSQKIISNNSFRSIQCNCEFCETFMSFSVDEFLKIDLI